MWVGVGMWVAVAMWVDIISVVCGLVGVGVGIG